jgi:HD-GYP domain-containing protein (c-di-GMP phosphodiesterase class II)
MHHAAASRVRATYPLRVHLATAFVLLASAIGGLAVYHTYRAGADLLLAAGNETIAHAARETSQHVRGLLAPAKLQLDLLARHSIATSTTFQERLSAVPFLATALDGNSNLASVRIGFESGDLFEIRRASGEELPAGAAYVVESLEHRPAGEAALRLVLDAKFAVLARVDLPQADRDPRYRRWFQQATVAGGVLRTDMSAQTSDRVGTSLSRRTHSADAVVAVDIALDSLSTRLQAYRLTPSTQIALTDRDGHVIAHPDVDRLVGHVDRRGQPRLAAIFETGEVALGDLYRDAHGRDARLEATAQGREWIGVAQVLLTGFGDPVTLLLAVPRDELLAEAREQARAQVVASAVLVLIALPLAWWVSRSLSRPLERLAREARSIQSFDFEQRSFAPSRIVEVDDLTLAMTAMRATIRQFLETSATLAAEPRLDRLLDRIVADTVGATGARSGVVYLLPQEGGELVRFEHPASEGESTPSPAMFPPSIPLAGVPASHIARAATSRVTVLDRGASGSIALATPLANRDGELVGVLALDLEALPAVAPRNGQASMVAFVEALSGAAAVAIETRHHAAAQKALLTALVELVAAAIDAKSPYTGGHCQRVPALAEMLARAACEARDGPFRDFALDENGWEVLRLASWLHDCGKVTTPEYVVDKATKLETLYNRIHEIRTRFEVLKRDAEVGCWKAVALEGVDVALARQCMLATWEQLDDEFAFIARCNVGAETMPAQDIERVRRIASRIWTRTIDDGLGLSEEERRRREGLPPSRVPATEPLLADRPDHLVPHPPGERIPADNPWGIALMPLPHRLDLGEVRNLCVSRGTLTAEERFLVNDHIVQTILMLSKLPFPKHLRDVPEVACGHHERMDGNGYPRRLQGAQMSVPARIMAIADVFEALTAADRPYKTGKSLGESLAIMQAMASNGHIDPDLFALFVAAEVPRRYGEQFLDPAQLGGGDSGARALQGTAAGVASPA